MNHEPTFTDYVKAAFHFTVPVSGIGGLPLNYLFIGISLGFTIAYWPFLMFCSAVEFLYLMVLASHPRFQRAVRSRVLQLGKMETESTLDDLVKTLPDPARMEYQNFCRCCDESMRMGKIAFGPSGESLMNSYDDNIRKFRMIFAKMLRMREILERNSRPGDEDIIRKRIEELESCMADADVPDVTRESERNTLQILNQRLEIQTKIREQLSHITAEIARLKEELLLVRDQVLINSSSPTALGDKVTETASVVQQHSDWLRDQGQFLQQIEME